MLPIPNMHKRLIAAIRDAVPARGIPILVGGYTMLTVDSLWRRLGADGTARDAREALAVAEKVTRGEKENAG